MEILTLTFGCDPTKVQAGKIDKWLTLSRKLWNFGLEKLEELDDRKIFDKQSKTFVPRSRIVPYYENSKKNKGIPYSEQLRLREKGWLNVCPIDKEWKEPMLQAMGVQSKGGLSLCGRSDLLPSADLQEIPAKFRQGLLAMLDTPWQEWRKSLGTANGRGKPKYKAYGRDEIDVIYSGNTRKDLKCRGDEIYGIPSLGALSVPGLSIRWRDDHGGIPEIAAFRILRRGNRHFVQLSGEVKESPKAPVSNQSVGVDPGIVYKLSTSHGYRKPEHKKANRQRWNYEQNKQRKIDHKKDHNALMWLRHPCRCKKDVAEIVPISDASWERLRAAKTLDEVIGAIGNYRFQRIKHRIPESNKQKKLKESLRKHKAKDGARRKSWDDAWTTLTARKFGFIAVEDGLQEERNRHRPESVSNDGGKTYEKNGAKRKAKFNRRLGEAAPGRTNELLQRKAKRFGREFVKIPAMGTTINCPVCGTDNQPELKKDGNHDRLYKCGCGWECDRDIHAGVNIELAAFGLRDDVALSPLAEKARTLSSAWQDSHPNAVKPLWVNGFKDAAKKYGRDAYAEGISDGFGGQKKGKGKKNSKGSRKRDTDSTP